MGQAKKRGSLEDRIALAQQQKFDGEPYYY